MKNDSTYCLTGKRILIFFTIMSSFLLFTSSHAQSPATVKINTDSIILTPPLINGFEAMNVRIMAPDGILIVNERSSGEAIEWIPGPDDPDGRYNYEAVVISYNPDSVFSLEEEDNGEEISRTHGSFKIVERTIIVPDEGSPDQQQQSLMNTLNDAAQSIASKVMNFLLPTVYAADVFVEDTTPEIYFDDTQDEDYTPGYDWIIRAEGGTSDSDTNNYFRLSGYGETAHYTVPIIRIDHDGANGLISPENALRIMDNGNISFADDRLFFSKYYTRLGIGTITPQHELQIHGASPEIRFHDETEDTYAQIEYNFGDLTFEGNTEQDILSMDGTAPEDSMYINSGGNIGIGISYPVEAVDVYRSASAARFQLTSVTDTASEAPQFVQRRARSGPSAVQAWDNLGLISFRGHNGSSFTGSRAFITSLASQNWSGGSNGTQLLFGTTPNNSSSPNTVLRITQDGRVLINGTQLNVPDYVFKDSYNLMPLDELEKYIRDKKHLPNVANALEVNSDGLDLGKTQMSLLEKVEELTLYTLQQHGQLKGQEAVLSEQQTKLSTQQAVLWAQQKTLSRQQAELAKKDASIKTLEERLSKLEAALNMALK